MSGLTVARLGIPALDPTPTGASTPPADALDAPVLLMALGIVAITVLATTLIIVVARTGKNARNPAESIVRGWMAVALVVGLLLLTVMSFGLQDSALRSALVGGITASVGAAIAFYFSAKSAETARQDMLNATVGTETVPDLTQSTIGEAKKLLGTTTFRLIANDSAPSVPGTGNSVPGDTVSVKRQDPAPNTQALKGSAITVHPN
ncbi:MAG: PASTA domain-containing protein [Specibacter sp.]